LDVGDISGHGAKNRIRIRKAPGFSAL
jgi:hypothetical protein